MMPATAPVPSIAMAERVLAACRYIDGCEHLPDLQEVAEHVGWSAAHLQRQFVAALGVSPRGYGDAGRQARLRHALRGGEEIAQAIYGAGFGSSSRVYEFAARYLGMTPADYRRGGAGAAITYLTLPCPVGDVAGVMLLAATAKGLCRVSMGEDAAMLEEELRREFPAASYAPADGALAEWAALLLDYVAGDGPWPMLPYDIKATAFQRRVWEWLRAIPSGSAFHYEAVAQALGQPNACRAVARACASNPVALVIPCHRILPKAGGVGGYRWQPARKHELLALEKKGS